VRVLLLCALLLSVTSGCRSAAPGRPAGPARVDAAPLRFQDTAAALGVRFQCGLSDVTPLNITRMVNGGAGWLDYDSDGWPDLLLSGLRAVRLYHNERGRTFRDVTAGSGLEPLSGEPQGATSADYDGDSRPDLLVTLLDGMKLFRNVGAGKFQDVTRAAGLSLHGWATSAAFADVNSDGRLDLYVGRYVRFAPGMPEYQVDGDAQLSLGPDVYDAEQGRFYLNVGDGRFREATRMSGLGDAHGKTLGVSFTDYDADGDQDLYLANDQALGDFYQNDGRGRFRNVGLENGTAASGSGRRQAGMGVDWGDYNRDGRLDLFVSTFYNEPKSLYRQDAGGVFTEVAQSAGLTLPQLRGTAFGVAFADWNNDGIEDLMLANGHVQDQLDRVDAATGYRQRAQVFLNHNGMFQDVSAGAGPAFEQKIVGRALAVADYDRDGRLDAVIANFAGPPLLLHNESTSGNWLGIRLQGKSPNQEGLGALIRLTSGGVTQIRSVQTGRSYLSAFPAEAHFGLGTETRASAEIRWPDGQVQQVADLKLNSVNLVRQAHEGVSVKSVLQPAH